MEAGAYVVRGQLIYWGDEKNEEERRKRLGDWIPHDNEFAEDIMQPEEERQTREIHPVRTQDNEKWSLGKLLELLDEMPKEVCLHDTPMFTDPRLVIIAHTSVALF